MFKINLIGLRSICWHDWFWLEALDKNMFPYPFPLQDASRGQLLDAHRGHIS